MFFTVLLSDRNYILERNCHVRFQNSWIVLRVNPKSIMIHEHIKVSAKERQIRSLVSQYDRYYASSRKVQCKGHYTTSQDATNT